MGETTKIVITTIATVIVWRMLVTKPGAPLSALDPSKLLSGILPTNSSGSTAS